MPERPLPPTPPKQAGLYANMPNPFARSTLIRYDLVDPVPVNISIFDLQGRRVRVLEDVALKPPGTYDLTWDTRDGQGRQVSMGVYFYRLQAGPFRQVRKMVLLR